MLAHDDHVAGLRAMLSELRARCPTLCPSVIPDGYDDRERGTALAALCGANGAEERAALADVLVRARRGQQACALTGEAVGSESELRFVSQWDLDPSGLTMRLRRCSFVCQRAALLLDPLLVLERFAAHHAGASELSELTALFCTANGRAEMLEKPARALEWLQQCYSLAYSCRVVASSLGEWRLQSEEGAEIGRPVHRVAARLLGLGEGAGRKKVGERRSPASAKPERRRAAGTTPSKATPRATPSKEPPKATPKRQRAPSQGRASGEEAASGKRRRKALAA
ncbi:hypothetical protein EMIHUDRAFT_218682 [Emiliania huxleyi CCMP1516]|uniref:Uncharacterized protein n=2 Tax=Emiliania huxleyi TaxID=2903 RepID=A0A0D3I6S5_EMIH1|nr:hypothetical protein EMIHUDRAFT_218682 [Emiliania huxleyi CCMP1516]EOD06960.1 hypothetical protein EMIHUDRAFT_218682 [Emiliania huxleyi CCMP1516]|eukprot:XP_005759389.1 hypothetical protein EMIHUDRAFT_218682 [Emiliania huxleyi CCMP1516]